MSTNDSHQSFAGLTTAFGSDGPLVGDALMGRGGKPPEPDRKPRPTQPQPPPEREPERRGPSRDRPGRGGEKIIQPERIGPHGPGEPPDLKPGKSFDFEIGPHGAGEAP